MRFKWHQKAKERIRKAQNKRKNEDKEKLLSRDGKKGGV